jgi:hypothetical protein
MISPDRLLESVCLASILIRGPLAVQLGAIR